MKTTVGVIKFFSKEKNIMVVKLFKKTTSIIVALLLIFSLIGIAGYKVLASTDKAYAGTDFKASIEIETENYNITVPGFALDEYLINDIIGFFP